jgi:hypothetical protein
MKNESGTSRTVQQVNFYRENPVSLRGTVTIFLFFNWQTWTIPRLNLQAGIHSKLH